MKKKEAGKEEVKITEKILSFEEMKKMVDQYKSLQKQIKALPKEEREKLLPAIHKREIPESLKDLAGVVFSELKKFTPQIKTLFDISITLEKPEGNKSISLSIDECDYSIAIIRRGKKNKTE